MKYYSNKTCNFRMIFKQFFDAESCTYTYLVGSEPTRDALIIDSVLENIEDYKNYITSNNLNLLYVLDTHIHADHISGMSKLNEYFDCQMLMGKETLAEGLTRKLDHNDELNLGNLKVRTMFTPGHTSDSYCFLIADKIFTGDTLLIGETGRTDFQNGSSISAFNSLFNLILKLPDATVVYPGHDYNGQSKSTIGEEKKSNPRLQVKSQQEYVDMMKNLNLPIPRKMDVSIPRNLRLGRE